MMLLKRPDMHIDNNTDENENNSFEIGLLSLFLLLPYRFLQ